MRKRLTPKYEDPYLDRNTFIFVGYLDIMNVYVFALKPF